MGLLDGLEKMTPAQQGLLGMGLGMMGQRGSFSEAMGRGGLNGMAMMQQAQALKRKQALEDLQMEKYQYDLEKSRAEDDRELRYRNDLGAVDFSDKKKVADVMLRNGDIKGALEIMSPKRDGVPTGFIQTEDGSISPMPIAGGGNYMDYQVGLAGAKNAMPGFGEAERLALSQKADKRADQSFAIEQQKSQEPKPLTDGQSNAVTYGTRAQQAGTVLDSLEGKYSPLKVNMAAPLEDVPLVGALSNSALTPEEQKVLQAKRNFLTAVLRKESGATIGSSELDMGNKQYFPQPSDSPEVLQQKAQNRKTAIMSLRIAAGKDGSKQIDEILSQDAAPDIKQKKTLNGKTYIQSSDGHWYEQ